MPTGSLKGYFSAAQAWANLFGAEAAEKKEPESPWHLSDEEAARVLCMVGLAGRAQALVVRLREHGYELCKITKGDK